MCIYLYAKFLFRKSILGVGHTCTFTGLLPHFWQRYSGVHNWGAGPRSNPRRTVGWREGYTWDRKSSFVETWATGRGSRFGEHITGVVWVCVCVWGGGGGGQFSAIENMGTCNFSTANSQECQQCIQYKFTWSCLCTMYSLGSLCTCRL